MAENLSEDCDYKVLIHLHGKLKNSGWKINSVWNVMGNKLSGLLSISPDVLVSF